MQYHVSSAFPPKTVDIYFTATSHDLRDTRPTLERGFAEANTLQWKHGLVTQTLFEHVAVTRM